MSEIKCRKIQRLKLICKKIQQSFYNKDIKENQKFFGRIQIKEIKVKQQMQWLNDYNFLVTYFDTCIKCPPNLVQVM